MSQQISLRLPDKLLKDAKRKAKTRGFGNVQEYITAEIRDDIYEDQLTPKEYELAKRMLRFIEDRPKKALAKEDAFTMMNRHISEKEHKLSGKRGTTHLKE